MSASACPRCNGEMRKGEVLLSVGLPSGSSSVFGGLPMGGMGGMGLPMQEVETEAPLTWREKTGERKGLIIKSDEVRTMPVKGRRCLSCGYLELYVADDKLGLRTGV